MKTFKGRTVTPGTATAKALVSHGGLNTLAEGHHGLAAAQSDGLNDVVPVFSGVGDTGKAQIFIDVGGENSAL